MTAVELCARCAGDPRDGIGYHAFDCAEVAPKERVMTASERLEEARQKLQGETHGFSRNFAGALEEYRAAATSPLLARIEGLERVLGEASVDVRESVQRALDLEGLSDDELREYGAKNALRMVRLSAERAVVAIGAPDA